MASRTCCRCPSNSLNGLCCCRPGVGTASIGQRYAGATEKKKRAASAANASPKAGTLQGSGNGKQPRGCAENACVTMRQTTRRGNAAYAKHGRTRPLLQSNTRARSALSTACATRAKCRSRAASAAWQSRRARLELLRGRRDMQTDVIARSAQ